MPEDLWCYGPSGVDFNHHVSHLKGTPMTIIDAIPQQPWCCVVVLLVLWITDSGTVGDEVFCLWCDAFECGGVCLGHTEGVLVSVCKYGDVRETTGIPTPHKSNGIAVVSLTAVACYDGY